MTPQPKAIVLQTPLWGDERVWCKFARRNDIRAAVACPNLNGCSPGGTAKGLCSLNGAETQSPCAFDEPPDAPVWDDIRGSVGEYRKKGWI